MGGSDMSNWVLVFSDGTGQRGVREDGASRNSNIYRMHEAAKGSGIPSFYDPGLGAPEDGEPQWLRGFGFYHERYEKRGGAWLFSYRRLERTHISTSDGIAHLRLDRSGEAKR